MRRIKVKLARYRADSTIFFGGKENVAKISPIYRKFLTPKRDFGKNFTRQIKPKKIRTTPLHKRGKHSYQNQTNAQKRKYTRDGTRTRTAVKPADFKSAASTIPPPELFAVVSRTNIQKIRAKSKTFFVLSWRGGLRGGGGIGAKNYPRCPAAAGISEGEESGICAKNISAQSERSIATTHRFSTTSRIPKHAL